ncbi:MAG: FMN-binding protein [Ruminococcaceae bacterium]|nr:FMN-binding protein [Oscillospiraceae bacterium]
MKKSIKSVVVLVCICAVTALLLAVTNSITSPIIAENDNAAANAALLEVMPNGKDFEKLDLEGQTLPATVTEAYREAGGGYVFRLLTAGYGSDFAIMCGVNADGTVSGALCLSSTETLGYEKTFGENFVGKNAEDVDSVDTVSGATKTTAAYRAAVKDALNAAVILGGGSVDIRTEEEILADNLAAALPAGEGSFEKLFLTEVHDGVDAVYKALNGKGYVCVVGEAFIGTDTEGKPTAALPEGVTADVTALIGRIQSSSLEAMDLAEFEGVHKNVTSASQTASGNYVLEVNGAGYGIAGGNEYHPASGKYIVIRVSMTADGKIIDCLTVSQAESQGFGDACATEDFYGQFVGKTEADYKEIDAISGATLTTDGYTKAIERAFAAVKIFEGGAK